jgi:hypothetical protein
MGMCLAPCLSAKVTYPVVCSAFDERGDAATATLAELKLMLQISPATGGEPISLSTSVSWEGLIDCRVFFDRDSHYMAVGLSHLGLRTGPLRIIVADLITKKLVGDFVVQPNASPGESPHLAGFLRGNPTLVVLGGGAPEHPRRAFSTILFRVTGEQDNPAETRPLLENTAGGAGNVSFADARHNRLWLKSSPHPCPLRSVPLVADGPEGVKVDEPNAEAVCDVLSAIAYPDERTLVTAVTREPSDLVSRVDLAQHRAEQLALPATGGHGSYTSVERGFISPDGFVFAVARNLLSNSLFGDAHSSGTEVDVMQVTPLKLIGKVRLKRDADTASLSIGHRNGTVVILSFGSGRWTSEQLKSE